jgi:hypothetical protein
MEKEIFKDIKGYEGFYQISNLGRVKRLDRKVKHMGGYRILKGRFLNPHLGKIGYYSIDLRINNQREKCTIHRLLAIHFISNPENKPQVNHINGIKSDNRLCNLEWVTCSENGKHAYLIKLRAPIKLIGEKNPLSKLTENQVIDIKNRLKKGESGASIGRIYGVGRDTISLIKQNKNWKHLNN